LLGYAHERSYDARRFAVRSAVLDWVDAHARSGRRIGLAGYWTSSRFVPIYGLFGPRLRNHVEYVGPVLHAQVMAFSAPGPFREALARGGYDLLAVGRLQRPDLEHPDRVGGRPLATLTDPPEARWARAAGYVEVARDGGWVLLATRQAPQPSAQ
jgi:hypothetical protein